MKLSCRRRAFSQFFWTTTPHPLKDSIWFTRSSHVTLVDYYFWDSAAKGLVCVLLMRQKKATTTPVRLNNCRVTMRVE
jgi:hypothetical protein